MARTQIVVALGEQSRIDRAEFNNELDMNLPGHNLLFFHYEGGGAQELVARVKTEPHARMADLWVGAQGADVYIASPTGAQHERIKTNVGSEAQQVVAIILKFLGIEQD